MISSRFSEFHLSYDDARRKVKLHGTAESGEKFLYREINRRGRNERKKRNRIISRKDVKLGILFFLCVSAFAGSLSDSECSAIVAYDGLRTTKCCSGTG